MVTWRCFRRSGLRSKYPPRESSYCNDENVKIKNIFFKVYNCDFFNGTDDIQNLINLLKFDYALTKFSENDLAPFPLSIGHLLQLPNTIKR